MHDIPIKNAAKIWHSQMQIDQSCNETKHNLRSHVKKYQSSGFKCSREIFTVYCTSAKSSRGIQSRSPIYGIFETKFGQFLNTLCGHKSLVPTPNIRVKVYFKGHLLAFIANLLDSQLKSGS